MGDALADEVLHGRHLRGEVPPHEARPGGLGQGAGIEARLVVALGRGGGEPLLGGGGGDLAPGHAIDLVVEHDAGEVQVAAAGMDQVVAPDGQAVPVPGDHDHLQVRPGQLQPRGESQGPAVGHVQGIGVNIGGQPARAADAGDHRQPVLADAQLVHRPQQRAQRDAVPAAGTEKVGKLAQADVVPHLEVPGGGCAVCLGHDGLSPLSAGRAARRRWHRG